MKGLIVEVDLGFLILIGVIIGIVIPIILFIIGLVQLKKNKKRGQLILIIATIYSIISFGMCGGYSI